MSSPPAEVVGSQADPVDAALQRARWQETVLADRLRRRELLALRPTWPTSAVRLRVWRTEPFEFVASVLDPFLAFGGLRAETALSDYDDSLSFALSGPADVELLWLDFGRYERSFAPEAVAGFVAERLRVLRTRTSAPILVADPPGDGYAAGVRAELDRALGAMPGVRLLDRSAVARRMGAAFHDPRVAAVSGSPVSEAAHLELARRLGMVWLPAAVRPRLKAVAVDLDHTLYSGVLGEDGPRGVALTDAHAELQRALVRLRDDGVFLALVSRNEAADVEALFAQRPDFPLRPEHVSARAISWGAKAEGLQQVATALRIGRDAVLFIDDNPGELAAVAQAAPEVKLLHAARPEAVLRALELYPTLRGYPRSTSDAVRADDLAVAAQRDEAARSAADPIEYLRSLQLVLRFRLNPRSQLQRLAEMSHKTNQFNTTLSRYSEAQVAERLDSREASIVSVALSDRLSDSGVIAVVFARRDGTALVIDELDISCRALGRQIEDVLVAEALRTMLANDPVEVVRFRFAEGPRNGPAREWLERFAGRIVDGQAVLPWSVDGMVGLVERTPVTVVWEQE